MQLNRLYKYILLFWVICSNSYAGLHFTAQGGDVTYKYFIDRSLEEDPSGYVLGGIVGYRLRFMSFEAFLYRIRTHRDIYYWSADYRQHMNSISRGAMLRLFYGGRGVFDLHIGYGWHQIDKDFERTKTKRISAVDDYGDYDRYFQEIGRRDGRGLIFGLGAHIGLWWGIDLIFDWSLMSVSNGASPSNEFRMITIGLRYNFGDTGAGGAAAPVAAPAE